MTGSRRPTVKAEVVLSTVAVVAIALGLWHGIAALQQDDRKATNIGRTTTALERQIAIGRYVADHLAVQTSEEHRIEVALPASIDDQSILAGVTAATAVSGTDLSSEQRGQPGSSPTNTNTTTANVARESVHPAPGLARLPLTITVNGPSEQSLIAFAAALEAQPRLLSATSLSFTFLNGASLQIAGSAFERSLASEP